MQKQPFWKFILAALLMFGSIYFLYQLVHDIVISAFSLKPEAVGAFTTIIVAVITIVGGRYAERKKDIEAKLRDRKVAIYDKFIGTLMEQMLNSDKPNNNELILYLRSNTKDFVLWFSADVLKEFSMLRQMAVNSAASKTTPKSLLRQYEKVLYAIRKDLGNSNRNLKTDDISRIYINDIDTM